MEARSCLLLAMLVYGVLVLQTDHTGKGYAMALVSESGEEIPVDRHPRKFPWTVRAPPPPWGNNPVRGTVPSTPVPRIPIHTRPPPPPLAPQRIN